MLGNFCLGSTIQYCQFQIGNIYIHTYVYMIVVCSSEITFKDGNRMQCAWGLPNVTLLKIT